MNDIKKFLFDLHDFDEESLAKKRKAKEPPPPPSFSEAQLEAARAEAYQKGRIAGIDEERRSLNQKINDTVAGFQAQFASLFAQEEARNVRFVDDTIALVLDALEKAFPVLYAAGKGDEMEAFLKDQIMAHIKTPSLAVRVNPAMKAEIEARMDAILARMSLAGQWTVLADESVPEGHCKILWSSGGAEWTPMHLHLTILKFFKDQIGPGYAPYIAPEAPAPGPAAAPAPQAPAPAAQIEIDMRDEALEKPDSLRQDVPARDEPMQGAPLQDGPVRDSMAQDGSAPDDLVKDGTAGAHISLDIPAPSAPPVLGQDADDGLVPPQDATEADVIAQEAAPPEEPEGMERVAPGAAMPGAGAAKPPVIDVDAEETDKDKPAAGNYMSGLADFGDDVPPAP